MPAHFQQLELGLARLSFPVYHAPGFTSRIIGWGGGSPDEAKLTALQIGDVISAGRHSNRAGVNVHTSLRIDDMAEEEIALATVALETRTAEEATRNAALSLAEDRRRLADLTHVESRTLAIDGAPESWTVVVGEDAWTATRHHNELTVTVAARDVDFGRIRLERVRDPISLDRPEWKKPTSGPTIWFELEGSSLPITDD